MESATADTAPGTTGLEQSAVDSTTADTGTAEHDISAVSGTEGTGTDADPGRIRCITGGGSVLMIKPTVFNYMDFVHLSEQFAKLQDELDKLKEENTNLKIKCRILEEDRCQSHQ